MAEERNPLPPPPPPPLGSEHMGTVAVLPTAMSAVASTEQKEEEVVVAIKCMPHEIEHVMEQKKEDMKEMRRMRNLLLSMAYIPQHERKVKEGEKELHPEVLAPKFDEQLRLRFRHAGSKGWKTNLLPFKRMVKEGEKELHPEVLAPKFDEQLRLRFRHPKFDEQLSLRFRHAGSKGWKTNVLRSTIQYAENSIVRCFPVGSMENGELPDSICLEPFLRPDSLDYGHRTGRKYFVLHNVDEPKGAQFISWWDSKESISLEKLKRGFLTEINPKSGVSKVFNTDVTEEYMSFVENKVVQDIGLTLRGQKDEYHLKIEDKQLPDCMLTCRFCIKAIKISKPVIRNLSICILQIEASPLRHLVVDLSCVFQDFDLRIMLTTKRIVESFTFLLFYMNSQAEEKHCIKEVIESAILDPNVKGGLRWSLGKDSAGGRFYVQESFHILSRSFAGPTVRLKLRNADRFNLSSSHGKISDEVSVKLIGVRKHLKVKLLEAGGGDEAMQECLQDTLKLIWDNFINCKS
ncbi:hypothetical protein EJ110_NYTH20612 [Nymphaea thermarum]|nr:hypothetical protein EJ110_NYTH20612 [Nymphaea thermarum]